MYNVGDDKYFPSALDVACHVSMANNDASIYDWIVYEYYLKDHISKGELICKTFNSFLHIYSLDRDCVAKRGDYNLLYYESISIARINAMENFKCKYLQVEKKVRELLRESKKTLRLL